MPQLERWIVASKTMPVFDSQLLAKIAELGSAVGSAVCEVHQHVHVTAENKEKIEELLQSHGYTVTPASGFVPASRSGRFSVTGHHDTKH